MAGNNFSLSQQQRLQQTMAPQMRQSLKILQTSILDLRAELQHEMELNPVIEDVQGKNEELISQVAPDEHTEDSPVENEDGLKLGDYRELNADDGFSSLLMGGLGGASGDEEAQTKRDHLFNSQVKRETLQEHLQNQLEYQEGLTELERQALELLILNVNDSGRFDGSVPDILMALADRNTSEREASEALEKMRQHLMLNFDPQGCGAKNLQECLLAQMEKLDDSPWEDEIRRFLTWVKEDFDLRKVKIACEKMHLNPQEFMEMLAEIKRNMDPHPGRKFEPSGFRPQYVTPEVTMAKDEDGGWSAVVRSRYIPEVRISPRYRKMLEKPTIDAETKSYIREKIRSAEALKDALEKRQQTIRSIAQAIIDEQSDFFEKGFEALKPLTMISVAEKVGVHETTVSRTVKDKYMITPQGVIEMRKFFSSGVSGGSRKPAEGSAEGAEQAEGPAESVSQVAVKMKLKRIVEDEDIGKPLSDDKIAKILEREHGIKIARRTVAKYRIALGIAGANERRVNLR